MLKNSNVLVAAVILVLFPLIVGGMYFAVESGHGGDPWEDRIENAICEEMNWGSISDLEWTIGGDTGTKSASGSFFHGGQPYSFVIFFQHAGDSWYVLSVHVTPLS